MSKVLEETWEARLWYHHANDAQRPVSEIYLPDAPSGHERCISAFEPETWDSDSASAERCQLAACAPEMARMLLKWWNCGFKDSDYGATCPECMGEQDFSDAVAMRNEVRLKHEPDCELDLLLRKAVVLP